MRLILRSERDGLTERRRRSNERKKGTVSGEAGGKWKERRDIDTKSDKIRL